MKVCSVEGCGKRHYGRVDGAGPGYCQLHWSRVRQYGTWGLRTCSVPWCDSGANRGSLCQRHWREERLGGVAPQGHKRCGDPDCTEPIKLLSQFSKHGTGKHPLCKACRSRARKASHAARSEEDRARRNSYYALHAEEIKDRVAAYRINRYTPVDAVQRPEACAEGVECQRRPVARGLCRLHYERRKKAGTLPAVPSCVIKGCGNDGLHGGPCRPHRDEYAVAKLRWCASCKSARANDQFSRGRRQCRACDRVKNAEYRAKNPGIHHGLTGDMTDRLLAEQDGKCRICLRDFGPQLTAQIDHDRRHHPGSSGCPTCARSLLCRKCNCMLGYAQDNPDILRLWSPSAAYPAEVINSAIQYCEHWNAVMAERGISRRLAEGGAPTTLGRLKRAA